jgi:hypothetical protein
MIIHLRKSTLFTISPDLRFAREYNLPKGFWTELWKRHKLLGYDIPEICQYYHFKTGRKTTSQSMNRWIWRSEIYSRVQPIMKKGVKVVSSEFFDEYEYDVIKELMKNVRTSVKRGSKIIV